MSVIVRHDSGCVEIVLVDDLRHPRFSWPRSRIGIPVDLPHGWNPSAVVASCDGRPVPVQFAVSHRSATGTAATAYLLADLPAGARRVFRLEPASPAAPATAPADEPATAPAAAAATAPADGPAEGVLCVMDGSDRALSNGRVRVLLASPASVMAGGPLLRIGDADRWIGAARLAGAGTPVGVEIRERARGAVFCEYLLDMRFAGQRRYRLTVRLTAGMDFVELDERVEGFAGSHGAALVFAWDAIGWTHRYCANRPEAPEVANGHRYRDVAWEPVDQRLGPGGALPIELVPYHNWLTWWRLPAAAFWSEPRDVSVGVFVADHERWDDGEYAIWASSPTLAGRFYFDEGRLRWHFPLAAGTRALGVAVYPHAFDVQTVDRTGIPVAHIDTLHRWHAWLPLNKVKDWVLGHTEPPALYPRFFDTTHHPLGVDRVRLLSDLIARDAPTLNTIPDGTPRSNHGPTPVGSREVHELLVPLFDEVAGGLDEDRRRDLGAALQFLAYVFEDETLMPTRRLLAGHPNFLADVLIVVAALPFLFPNHPHARRMADHVERVTAVNFKYHTRPDVPAWRAQGGRWTENPACYAWRPVELATLIGHLLRRFFDGHNRVARPESVAVGYWLLNTLSAPLERAGGRRTLPPQGAHSHGEAPYPALRVLGQELARHDPLLAEYLLWAAPASSEDGEQRRPESYDLWAHLQSGEWSTNAGTDPQLESTKFTGYGFVLRAAVGTRDEVTVYLQQIDAGPNYRWGRAARGGNGVVYYYAAGRRHSFNNVEDVGDLVRGDTERCTNFGVRKPGGYRELGPYRSVGQNDLTGPLHDLGVAQYARVNAGASAAPEYAARHLLLAGADYIVLFDEVRDGVPGRFSWFVDDDADLPTIAQLVPGAPATEVPAEPDPAAGRHVQHPWRPTKGRYYDGVGSFLTVVSHHDGARATATPYGCLVRVGQHEDLVFLGAQKRRYRDDRVAFEGTVGFVRRRPAAGHEGDLYDAALFVGTHLAVPGFAATTDGTVALSVLAGAVLTGVIDAPQAATVWLAAPAGDGRVFYLDGQPLAGEHIGGSLRLRIPAGHHRWEWTAGAPTPGRPTVLGTHNHSGGAVVLWTPIPAAVSYQVQVSADGGRDWRVASTVPAVGAAGDGGPVRGEIAGLADGAKVHVRVVARGAAADGQPSRPYPVYVTAGPPPCPDGLLLSREPGGIRADWGEVLGAQEYRLYRRRAGEDRFTRIAAGPQRHHVDAHPDDPIAGGIVEYRVSAVNGNGESPPSTARNTDPDGPIDGDPRPDEVFRRATQSYEIGYDEVNPWIEEQLPTLSYPSPGRSHWHTWRR